MRWSCVIINGYEIVTRVVAQTDGKLIQSWQSFSPVHCCSGNMAKIEFSTIKTRFAHASFPHSLKSFPFIIDYFISTSLQKRQIRSNFRKRKKKETLLHFSFYFKYQAKILLPKIKFQKGRKFSGRARHVSNDIEAKVAELFGIFHEPRFLGNVFHPRFQPPSPRPTSQHPLLTEKWRKHLAESSPFTNSPPPPPPNYPFSAIEQKLRLTRPMANPDVRGNSSPVERRIDIRYVAG